MYTPEDRPTATIIEHELAGIQWECNSARGRFREFILCADGAKIYNNGKDWVMEGQDASWCAVLTTVQNLRDALAR